jgi:hypothetical protein
VLTIAIDVCTRMVAGFHLALEAPVGSHFGVRIQFEQNQCFMLSHFS